MSNWGDKVFNEVEHCQKCDNFKIAIVFSLLMIYIDCDIKEIQFKLSKFSNNFEDLLRVSLFK